MRQLEKLVWIDYLKVIMIFGVVMLHVSSPLTYKFNDIPLPYWLVAHIIDSLLRMCVPIFFMISGYLIINKNESLHIFYNKRIKKVLIPLIFWSIIFLFWKELIYHEHRITFIRLLRIIVKPEYYHLWFMYAMLGGYVFIPIIRAVANNSERKIEIYLILVWIVSVSILPLIEKLSGYIDKIGFMSISGYIGYFAIGAIFNNFELSKRRVLIAYFLFITSLIFTIFSTYYLTDKKGIFTDYFYGYLGLNIIIYSTSAFTLLKYYLERLTSTGNNNLLNTICSASLGIYLIHPIFQYHLSLGHFGFTMNAFIGNPLIYIPLTAIFVFCLSLISVIVLKKIPLIRIIVP